MSSSPTYTVVDQFDEDEFPDIPKAPAALLAALNTVPDPRKPRGVRHSLPGILAIAACAVIAGARSFVAIAEWAAAATPAGLAKFGVTGEVPSESTFRRTINKLDGNGLDFILGAWAAHGFAVHRDHPEFLRIHLAERGPGAEDEIQAVAVEFVDGAPEGRFAGHLTGDAEFRQPRWGGRGGPFADRHERAGTGDDGARRDRQDPGQCVPHSPGFAGIGHRVQRGQQRRRCFRDVGELVLVELVNDGVRGR